MARRFNNLVPLSMAVILHVVLLSSMVIAFDFARPAPITPMAIQATLVTEMPVVKPPVVERAPEPEPEPEPVVEEPEPEPDNSEELRRQAEEDKRVQDAFIEKERLEKIRKQEEADRQRKIREEEQRKKDEEARKERERVEAERKRQEDVKRQQEENDRIRRELEDEQRADEIADEERRLAASNSPAMDAYVFAIANKIQRNWSAPASASEDLDCVVNVRQLAGGDVIDVRIVRCGADDAVKRSAIAAVNRASPLPQPSNPDLFRANLELHLRPPKRN